MAKSHGHGLFGTSEDETVGEEAQGCLNGYLCNWSGKTYEVFQRFPRATLCYADIAGNGGVIDETENCNNADDGS